MNRRNLTLSLALLAGLLAAAATDAGGSREMPLLVRSSGGGHTGYLYAHSEACEVYPDRIVSTRRVGTFTTTQIFPVSTLDRASLRDFVSRAAQQNLTVGGGVPADVPFAHYFASYDRRNDVQLRTLNNLHQLVVNDSYEGRGLRTMIDRLCPPPIPGWED